MEYFRINKDEFRRNVVSIRHVALSVQETSYIFAANICFGYEIGPEGNKQPTQKYLLMQGLKSDEMILLRETNLSEGKLEVEPIELIVNITKKYVSSLFP